MSRVVVDVAPVCDVVERDGDVMDVDDVLVSCGAKGREG